MNAFAEATTPAVFLDRDGVINVDRGYVSRWSEFEFLPGAVSGLAALQELGYRLVIVTNQSGIGRGYYSEGDFALLSTQLIDHLKDAGVSLTAIYHCPHHPTEAVGALRTVCDCRKPAPGMILRAARELNLALPDSVLVGDKSSDILAGRAAGVGRLFRVGDPSKESLVMSGVETVFALSDVPALLEISST